MLGVENDGGAQPLVPVGLIVLSAASPRWRRPRGMSPKRRAMLRISCGKAVNPWVRWLWFLFLAAVVGGGIQQK